MKLTTKLASKKQQLMAIGGATELAFLRLRTIEHQAKTTREDLEKAISDLLEYMEKEE